MFYVTLVPTLILFAVALWAAFGKPDGTRPGIFIATAIVLVTLCVFAGFIPTVTIVFCGGGIRGIRVAAWEVTSGARLGGVGVCLTGGCLLRTGRDVD